MRGQRGVTLIELVVAITIVAISVGGVLAAISAVSSRSADAMVQQQAISIAEAYLEEILQRWVVDPNGTPANSGRGSWDRVDQYDALVDAGARDQYGNAIAALAGYTVSVAVTPSGGLGGIASAAARRIDITVTHAPNVAVVLTGYRTSY